MAIVCWTADLMAQNQTGKLSIRPMVGVNLSDFGNASIDMYKMKVGLTGGAELEYGLNPWLGLSIGLMYSQQGAKIDGSIDAMVADDNGNRWLTKTQMNGKLKCDYLNLPLMANVYIPAIKGLAFKAGVQVGIMNAAWVGTFGMRQQPVACFKEGAVSTCTTLRLSTRHSSIAIVDRHQQLS